MHSVPYGHARGAADAKCVRAMETERTDIVLTITIGYQLGPMFRFNFPEQLRKDMDHARDQQQPFLVPASGGWSQ